jgi:hypothetical protein
MDDQFKSRTLSAQEFEAIRQRVLSAAPPDLSEADFYRWVGPRMAEAIGKAEYEKPAAGPDAQGALRRGVMGAADVLNPLNIIEGGLQMVASPLETTKQVWSDMGTQATKARDAFGEGRYSEAIGHGAASVIPMVGPAAADTGEQIADGDVAGGIGRAVALTALTSPSAVRGTVNTARSAVAAPMRERAAASLEAGAANRVADVMSPKVGQNKVRFGNKADEIAPSLVDEGMTGGWTREGLHNRVQDRYVQAQQKLDEAADARLSARSFDTAPIIRELEQRLGRITAQTVDATASTRTPTVRISSILDEQGKPIEVPGFKQEPYGKSVVPDPSNPQAAMIRQAIEELRALGPTARYDAIRTIRQSYDKPASVKYNPSMTADYLKNQGKADGAADVTYVLREQLAKFDPQTATANAEYSLFRSADDVLRATAEVERTRPKVGRAIMARLTGTIGGAQAGGPVGAAAGFVLAPIVESAVGSGVTIRLQTASLMKNLATAIRKGDEAKVISVLHSLKQIGKRTPAIQGATSPTERRTLPRLVIQEGQAR